MALFRSSNPAFRNDVYGRAAATPAEGVMTMAGTTTKAFILIALTFAFTIFTWVSVPVESLGTYLIGGAIGGLIVALVTIFKPHLSPWTAPVYAVLEGFVLGAVSALANLRYPGLPLQAVVVTMAIFMVMLVLYRSGTVRATPRFRKVLMTAALGLLATYVLHMVLGFFGSSIPLVHSASPLGIGFSVVACGIAAFFFILDFDQIAEGVERGAPKYMEWYGGFTLLMTLVWLYLEVLRLLDKLRR